MKPTLKLVAEGTAALLLAPMFSFHVQGRQSGTPPPSGIDRILIERDRVFNSRTVEDELRRPAGREDPQLALEQIKEDYTRIQVVNNELVLAAMRGGALDLKLVTKTSAEIKKRAERLKNNLILPEPEKTVERPMAAAGDEEARLRASALALGKLVAGFVRNPMFREVKVVDAQSAARARRDLEAIIELSGQLKKESEKLDKASRKPN